MEAVYWIEKIESRIFCISLYNRKFCYYLIWNPFRKFMIDHNRSECIYWNHWIIIIVTLIHRHKKCIRSFSRLTYKLACVDFCFEGKPRRGSVENRQEKKPEFSKVGKTDRTPLYSTQQRGDTVTRSALTQWVKGLDVVF